MWKFIENIGDKTIISIQSSFKLFYFIVLSFLHLVRPASYHPSFWMELVSHIYFTSIKLLPFFVMMAFLFGNVMIGIFIVVATKFNLFLQTGSIITTIIVGEFSPFFTAILLSLRSSTALNAKIALMKINNELEINNDDKVVFIDKLFLPYIVNGIISSLFLSIVFAVVMISSGYIFVLFYLNMDFYSYFFIIFDALEVREVLTLLIKSMVFGFFIMVIPIYSALQTTNSVEEIHISVLNGIGKLFLTLFVVEVLSLVLQSF